MRTPFDSWTLQKPPRRVPDRENRQERRTTSSRTTLGHECSRGCLWNMPLIHGAGRFAKMLPIAQAEIPQQLLPRPWRTRTGQQPSHFFGDLRGDLRGSLRGEPWRRAERNDDRAALLFPNRGRIGIIPAPVDHLQGAGAPLFDNPGTIEHARDDRIPRSGLVRLGQGLEACPNKNIVWPSCDAGGIGRRRRESRSTNGKSPIDGR